MSTDLQEHLQLFSKICRRILKADDIEDCGFAEPPFL